MLTNMQMREYAHYEIWRPLVTSGYMDILTSFQGTMHLQCYHQCHLTWHLLVEQSNFSEQICLIIINALTSFSKNSFFRRSGLIRFCKKHKDYTIILSCESELWTMPARLPRMMATTTYFLYTLHTDADQTRIITLEEYLFKKCRPVYIDVNFFIPEWLRLSGGSDYQSDKNSCFRWKLIYLPQPLHYETVYVIEI